MDCATLLTSAFAASAALLAVAGQALAVAGTFDVGSGSLSPSLFSSFSLLCHLPSMCMRLTRGAALLIPFIRIRKDMKEHLPHPQTLNSNRTTPFFFFSFVGKKKPPIFIPKSDEGKRKR